MGLKGQGSFCGWGQVTAEAKTGRPIRRLWRKVKLEKQAWWRLWLEAGRKGTKSKRVRMTAHTTQARLDITGGGGGESQDAVELSYLGDGEDDVIHRNRKSLAHLRNRKKTSKQRGE